MWEFVMIVVQYLAYTEGMDMYITLKHERYLQINVNYIIVEPLCIVKLHYKVSSCSL